MLYTSNFTWALLPHFTLEVEWYFERFYALRSQRMLHGNLPTHSQALHCHCRCVSLQHASQSPGKPLRTQKAGTPTRLIQPVLGKASACVSPTASQQMLTEVVKVPNVQLHTTVYMISYKSAPSYSATAVQRDRDNRWIPRINFTVLERNGSLWAQIKNPWDEFTSILHSLLLCGELCFWEQKSNANKAPCLWLL